MRVNPNQLVELLLPMFDPDIEKTHKVIAKGLPAGPLVLLVEWYSLQKML